jgi:glyoxylase I family protein
MAVPVWEPDRASPAGGRIACTAGFAKSFYHLKRQFSMTTNRPIECRGIDHVVLRVTDIERSLKFYVDILGLAVERVVEDMQLYQVRCGENLIDLSVLKEGERLADKPERGIDHLCLNVRADVDALEAYLEDNGVTITFGPVELYGATGFGTSMYVLDPDEYTIELKAHYAQWAMKTTAAEAMRSLTRPKD